MKIVDEIYKYLMSKGVVTVKEITNFSREQFGYDYKYMYKKHINPFLKKGLLKRIRRGMYSAVNIYLEESQQADRYIIASKVRPKYYLSYHTALELHGCAYSAFWTIFISIDRSDYFRPFEFEGIKYQPATQANLDIEVMTMVYKKRKIQVSSPSRTFVDCVHRRNMVSGLEECLKSLDGLRGVSVASVRKVLEIYQNNLLLRSVGFIIEKMVEHSPFYGHIKENDLDGLVEKVGKTPMYFEQGVSSGLNKRWNIYVPNDLEGLMRGI